MMNFIESLINLFHHNYLGTDLKKCNNVSRRAQWSTELPVNKQRQNAYFLSRGNKVNNSPRLPSI